MTNPTPKRPHLFIEERMPVQLLNEQVYYEHGGNPFKGLHRWYSRKPLSFSRASVLASLLPADVTMEEFEYLLGLEPGKEVKLYKTPPTAVRIKKVHDYCEQIWGTRTPTVLDAFAGGGSIPFEAARYGLNVLASDLNPVAVVTMKAAMEYPLKFGPDLQHDIDKWVKWVGDEAEKRLAEFFPSNPGETVQNYLWAHTVVCPRCESVVPLSPNWWLSKTSNYAGKGQERKVTSDWYAVKPIPNPENKRVDFELIKGRKGKGNTIIYNQNSVVGASRTTNNIELEYDPDTTTTISRGVGKCPNCGNVIEDDVIKYQSQSFGLKQQLYAIAYKKGLSNFEFRTPTDQDILGCDLAAKYLEFQTKESKNIEILPLELIINNHGQILNYCQNWSHLFNPRQLLVLLIYIQIINEAKVLIQSEYELEKSEAILTYLALVLDRCADANCRLVVYNASRACIQKASTQHALNLMWNHPEVNGASELWRACQEEAAEDYTKLANIHQHPGCLDFCLKSIPIKPWPHQIKILRRVAETFPKSFLIADEVGLGKTIETGLILRYLLLAKKAKRILILSPASVQPQWQEELREKFNLHFWSYNQNLFTVHSSLLTEQYRQHSTVNNQQLINPWNSQDLILASSHLVRRKERMQELLAAEPWDLVILDEAHHARRKSPQNRKETPNRLLELMQQLKDKTQALILLSATPMQIDAIEVFDLLNLLGIQGHWSYGDNFCNYFESLPSSVKPEILNFWQVMCNDYFQQGGKPCSRLQQFLNQQDKILAYKMQDLWQRGKKISNHKQLLADEDFINTSRQYLTVNTPLKDLMFRHTRDTLRQYYQRGLLAQDIPSRIVQDNAISLEINREVPLYQAVSNYVRHFYRLAQKDQRTCRGFLMTLYRKRLTSSFYAIKASLQRGLDCLLTKQGSFITEDDYADIDEANDAVISGMESFFEEVDPQEIQYLEDLLQQFENTGEDSKLSHFIQILRQELSQRESAIVFTQYTDTMDYLRDALKELYGSQVACYSGRGGELLKVNTQHSTGNSESTWCVVPKEEIKHKFRQDEIKILLCTESASEGLNLQNCGVLINYDMPWNPMRVEQRIGRIDRIGQRYETVRIHNFYYDGTVEAKVYRKLRDRINAFATVVGNLQPILAKVPTFIEQAAMSADPEEEDVLMSEFDSVLDAPLRPGIEAMVTMDLDADLAEIQKPIPPTPFTPESIEHLFTTSTILKSAGVIFQPKDEKTWLLTYKNREYMITFYPDVFDEIPSLRLMNFGEPLFAELLSLVQNL